MLGWGIGKTLTKTFGFYVNPVCSSREKSLRRGISVQKSYQGVTIVVSVVKMATKSMWICIQKKKKMAACLFFSVFGYIVVRIS